MPSTPESPVEIAGSRQPAPALRQKASHAFSARCRPKHHQEDALPLSFAFVFSHFCAAAYLILNKVVMHVLHTFLYKGPTQRRTTNGCREIRRDPTLVSPRVPYPSFPRDKLVQISCILPRNSHIFKHSTMGGCVGGWVDVWMEG